MSKNVDDLKILLQANAFGSTFAFFYNTQTNAKKNQKSYQANTQWQTAMQDSQARPKKNNEA